MGKITYKTIQKNSRLWQFSDLKEAVLANSLNGVPDRLKGPKEETNMVLDFFF